MFHFHPRYIDLSVARLNFIEPLLTMFPTRTKSSRNVIDKYFKTTGVAKVRPSKDFQRPLFQILDAQLSYL